MNATVTLTRKTKASAEREAAIYAAMSPELNFRVIARDGIYYVVRDWHPSDEGRNFQTITA